jgi:hypothetical protein
MKRLAAVLMLLFAPLAFAVEVPEGVPIAEGEPAPFDGMLLTPGQVGTIAAAFERLDETLDDFGALMIRLRDYQTYLDTLDLPQRWRDNLCVGIGPSFTYDVDDARTEGELWAVTVGYKIWPRPKRGGVPDPLPEPAPSP